MPGLGSLPYSGFAAAYDRLMADVDYGAWYRHYRALLLRAGVDKPRHVADVCCGTGRISISFAKDGISVVGADISPDMLAEAQESARRAGVRVAFVRMDAAALQLPRPADAIVCACDGVNYLASPKRAQAFFARAYASVRPGGALAFDVSTEYKFENQLDGRAFGEDLGDLSYLWTNEYDPASRLCHMQLTLFSREADGRYRREFEEHTQRAHSEEELLAWLIGAGFSRVEFFSETTLAPRAEDDARLHVLAVKQQK